MDSRFTAARLTRRRLLGGAATAAAAAATLAIAGCGDDDDDTGASPGTTPGGDESPAATPTPAPRKGGVLRINQTGDPVFNSGYPFIPNPTSRRLEGLVHEALIRYRNDVSKPELVLADRFEYSDDRTRLVVSIKPGATFHNGAPVTPEDVFFGIDFHLDPKQFGVTSAGSTNALARAIVSRKKVDERTMEFTFDRPRWDMTGFFATMYITQASNFAKFITGEDIQGTGPYAFKSWTPGAGYTLVRNANWHLSAQEGGPYLDEIRATNFADEATAARAFEAGELDVAFRVPASEAKRFGDRVRKAQKVGAQLIGMVVKNPVLADRRVRQALFLAVNKERIAKEVGEGFYPATSQVWPEYSPAYDPALDVPNYDPERARALLKEAGFSQGQPLELEYWQPGTAAFTVAQQDFEAIGVKVNLLPRDTNTLLGRLRNRQINDLYGFVTNLSDPVPASALLGNFNFHAKNIAYQENPELLEILQKLGTVDPLGPEAKELYARFNRLWIEDPWIIPVLPSGALDIVSPKVQGFDEYFVLPLQAPNWGRIWLKA